MSAKNINVILIDDSSERLSLLSAKLKPFVGSIDGVGDVNKALVLTKSKKINLVIVSEYVFNSYIGGLRDDLIKLGQDKLCLFVLKTSDSSTSLQDYYQKGVEGVFENSVNASTLMSAVRKSTLPQNLRWQVTLNQLPVESVSLISKSINDLHNFERLSFGRGGFSMQFDIQLKIGDRIGYSFYFSDEFGSYVIQGIAVVRWIEDNSFWAGVEFESMTGLGTNVFLDWVKDQNFTEYIPAVA